MNESRGVRNAHIVSIESYDDANFYPPEEIIASVENMTEEELNSTYDQITKLIENKKLKLSRRTKGELLQLLVYIHKEIDRRERIKDAE